MADPIRGQINGQHLTLKQDIIVADTNDYLTAEFAFSSEWAGLSIWAHFKNKDKPWDIRLTDGKILREKHLNLTSGTWEVYLHGTGSDGMRITTDACDLRVKRTGTLDGQPFPEVPLGPVEDLDRRVTELEENGSGGGTGGTTDYDKLTNKPSINGHELRAGMTSQELGIKDGEPGEDGKPGKDAPQDTVTYTSQALTSEQQRQARLNIGAQETEGKWEIIEDTTTDVDAKFERLAEPDGTLYKFRAMMVNITFGGESTTNSFGLRFEMGTSSDYKAIFPYVYFDKIKRHVSARVFPRYGYWEYEASLPVRTVNDPLTVRTASIDTVGQAEANRNCYYFGTVEILPANSHVVIKAVRA